MMSRRFEAWASTIFLLVGCGDSGNSGGAASGGAPVTAGSAAGGAGGEASDGGSGGAPPPACELPAEGCAADEKCSLADITLGIPLGLGCVDAGDGVAFSTCDSDTACGVGLFCDYTTSVCKPFCGTQGLTCADGAACVSGRDSAGLLVEGLFLCVASCDPQAFAMNPCGDDDGATCYFREEEDAFDCGANDSLGWGSSCTSSRQCRPGLGCFANENGSSSATMCLDWCSPAGAVNACYGTKADGTWFCSQFKPCGPCDATPWESPTGTPLGSCSWGE